ncbi:MAG: pyrimidine dimer DNA glycosylase/endonuclease V [Bacteroidales bacterium]
MRLWSLHPKYLDLKGLTAVWREGLLAQKVLSGETKGYGHHPQLIRFKATDEPLKYIGFFLHEIQLEATRRKYLFNINKIKTIPTGVISPIEVTEGQIYYEFEWLKKKVQQRTPLQYMILHEIKKEDVELNAIFIKKPGEIETWERISNPQNIGYSSIFTDFMKS